MIEAFIVLFIVVVVGLAGLAAGWFLRGQQQQGESKKDLAKLGAAGVGGLIAGWFLKVAAGWFLPATPATPVPPAPPAPAAPTPPTPPTPHP